MCFICTFKFHPWSKIDEWTQSRCGTMNKNNDFFFPKFRVAFDYFVTQFYILNICMFSKLYAYIQYLYLRFCFCFFFPCIQYEYRKKSDNEDDCVLSVCVRSVCQSFLAFVGVLWVHQFHTKYESPTSEQKSHTTEQPKKIKN